MYNFLNDALLRREIDMHLLRRASGRNWSYPGPQWMLVATLWQVPFIAIIGLDDWQGRIRDAAGISILWQTWLLCLRAVICCSVSVADEIEKKTVVVLHTTPLGTGRLLATKLGVCLWPLGVELYFASLFLQLLNWACPWTEWSTLLQVSVLQLSATFLYGCCGLWLGSLLGASERAAAWARATAMITLWGCNPWLGKAWFDKALTWPVLLAVGMIWFCLMLQPHGRPSRAYQGGVVALVLALLLPLLYSGTVSYLPSVDLAQFSPLFAVTREEGLAGSCLLYWVLALAFGLWSRRLVSRVVV